MRSFCGKFFQLGNNKAGLQMHIISFSRMSTCPTDNSMFTYVQCQKNSEYSSVNMIKMEKVVWDGIHT